ncbi:gfo/Idh/MocA family oxidoreductase [Actinobacteria bacterium YIM 96077]|uniref:Uncharacterized protein n=1 Tax=Phytoactinopolyspora halophila TaxID=1981511 RepID=A0A329QIH0_9ACTN|nr:Gfo/Idh/MocA family oxidoreductase [Phytoactinopolyspora halophila]AYY12387.1 gfo/Idh/MocA family oxidoreductase [Actinobacteria bacterium YIM 96077]RAW12036.1 hypothetical protein DPM12_15305 [Phytoactinopolyspora halophila]
MKALVVGAGFMGSLHARAIRDSTMADLHGVVDSSTSAASTLGAELGVKGFVELSEAIDEIEPDVAVIATPDSSHRKPAETLIKAGVHVLIEKPLATTVDDAEAILHRARARGSRVMTGHITRFFVRYTRVAEAVSGSTIGRPVMITTSTWGPKSIGARVAETTNPLWHFAIHDIDLIQWIGEGVVDEVDGAQLIESGADCSTFSATGSLSSGIGFNMVTGWTLPSSAAARWDLKVHCQGGVVQATWSGDGVTLYEPNGAHELDCTAWPSVRGQIGGALRAEVDHFLDAVTTGAPFLVRSEDALNAIRSAARLEQAACRRVTE